MFDLLPLLLGAVLFWAGALKLLGRARATLLRMVGAVEVAVGTAFLLPPAVAVEAAAGAALSAGFLLYLGYAKRTAPTASCGCMGARHAPITWRSFARAGGMLAASLGAFGAGGSVSAADAADALVLVVGAALFVAVSPEFDGYWLVPLRKLTVRLTHPLAGSPEHVPLHATVDQLQRSETFTKVAPLLRSDLREHWDEEEWRILTYTASYADREVTAVFAVPRLRDEPSAVRLALVDETLLMASPPLGGLVA